MKIFKKEFESEYNSMISADICADTSGSIHFVDGEGALDAKVMFIGEAPGQTEDRLLRPFMGAAGKLLDELLVLIGLKRSSIYITNIVKCRPPDNRDPEPSEIAAGLPYLNREIDLIKPKIIAFLGRHALNAFFPDLKISEVHGRPFRKAGQIYLPLYHPAAGLYRPETKKDLFADFKKIPLILEKKINKTKEMEFGNL